LLQQRAPKKSKGELVATSNFVNVTGAIAASILFGALVYLGQATGLTPPVAIHNDVVTGQLQEIKFGKHGKIERVAIKRDIDDAERIIAEEIKEELQELRVIDTADSLLDVFSGTPQIGDKVIVSRYDLRDRKHYLLRRADQPEPKIYDNEKLPSYLFLGAALMTTGILLALLRKLPDFFVRTLFWMRSLLRFKIKAVGMANLPTEGPVILATNCKDMAGCLQLVSATDRTTRVVLVGDDESLPYGPVLRALAKRTSLISVQPEQAVSWQQAKLHALQTLRDGHLLAISLEHPEFSDAVAALVHDLHTQTNAPLLPVYCGSLDASGAMQRIRVVFGELMAKALPSVEPTAIQVGAPTVAAVQPEERPIAELHALTDCKQAISRLGEWIRQNDDVAGSDHH
jgi:hypothetical protein